jgi:Glycosyltransferase family 87
MLFANENQIKRLFVVVFLALALSTIMGFISFFVFDFPQRNGLLLSKGVPVGGDYMAFYIAGKIVERDPDLIYNLIEQWKIQKEIFQEDKSITLRPLPFLYPPLVALPLKYLSRLDFVTGYLIWVSLGTFLYAFSVWMVLQCLGFNLIEKMLGLLIGLGFNTFLGLSIVSGQTSFLGVFILAAVYYLLKNNYQIAAGLVLSLSYYKPPLFLIFVLFIFLQFRWRMIAGFIIGGISLLALSCIIMGQQVMLDFFYQASGYNYGSEMSNGIVSVPRFGAGLLPLIAAFFPKNYAMAHLIFFIMSSGILIYFYKFLKVPDDLLRGNQFDLVFSLQVSLSILLSLHIINYDLSLLIVPLLITGSNVWHKPLSKLNIIFLSFSFLIYNEWLFRTQLAIERSINFIVPVIIVWIFIMSVLISREKNHIQVLKSQ